MRLVLLLALAGFVMLAAGAWLTAGPAARAADTTVEAGDFYFCDSSFENGVCQTNISAGDTITWNVAAGLHTVTQCDQSFSQCPTSGGFGSGSLQGGNTFQHTFDTAGTFYYHCDFHPGQMRGQITVAQQATPSPTPTAAPTGGASPTAGASPTVTPAGAPASGGPPADSDGSVTAGLALAVLGGIAVLAAAGLGLRGLRRQ